jgi:hypothetical protein
MSAVLISHLGSGDDAAADRALAVKILVRFPKLLDYPAPTVDTSLKRMAEGGIAGLLLRRVVEVNPLILARGSTFMVSRAKRAPQGACLPSFVTTGARTACAACSVCAAGMERGDHIRLGRRECRHTDRALCRCDLPSRPVVCSAVHWPFQQPAPISMQPLICAPALPHHTQDKCLANAAALGVAPDKYFSMLGSSGSLGNYSEARIKQRLEGLMATFGCSLEVAQAAARNTPRCAGARPGRMPP